MINVKLTVSYDGSAYCGWQTQPDKITIQGEIEKALYALTGENIRILGSGRTDSGVHALGQVATFKTNSAIPAERFDKALNGILPDDIRIIKSEQVQDGFSALFSAKKKTYIYSLYLSEVTIPFYEHTMTEIEWRTDVEKMRETASLFVGTHDFKCFSASGSSVKDTVRTIYNLEVVKNGIFVEVIVTGNGFLYNMVRTLVGTLCKVGLGKMSLEEVQVMLETGDRKLCGRTLASKGLCLKSVEYE